jgi:UDP-glucuronate decarboxylase
MEDNTDFCGPLNMGNPSEFTILELAKAVIDLTGSKSKISFKPLPSDDPKQRCPDISKAKELYRWEPKVSLREGLKQTINYFQNLIRDRDSSITE